MKYLKRIFTMRNTKGFTLVEVIVSTVLLGVLIIGIMMFMTPLFQNVDNSIDVERANRVATTMQQYLSKTLKNAMYVKIYTGVSTSDITNVSSALYTNAEYVAMKDKVLASTAGSGGAGKSLELRCISLRYIEDTNPRNSETGLPCYKYILSEETVDANYVVDNSQSTPVFSASFYERLYTDVEFERLAIDLNNDADDDPTTTPEDVMHPAYKYTINVYSEPAMETHSMLFSGLGVIELNNIKSLEINSDRKYTTYENTDLGTAGNADIYIFYVTRKHVIS